LRSPGASSDALYRASTSTTRIGSNCGSASSSTHSNGYCSSACRAPQRALGERRDHLSRAPRNSATLKQPEQRRTRAAGRQKRSRTAFAARLGQKGRARREPAARLAKEAGTRRNPPYGNLSTLRTGARTGGGPFAAAPAR